MTPRAGDDAPHPKELEREAQERAEAQAILAAAQQERRMTWWAAAGSTVLGGVALYPIIRGTRTDNMVMMAVGFLVAAVALKILPVDKLAGILSAWRGK